MKNDLSELLKKSVKLGKRYLKLQIDVAKLTLAEKLTLLLAGMMLGLFVCLGVGFVLLLLAFAAADLFKEIMAPALAYAATAGLVVVIMVVVYMLRKQLVINPIARLISKLVLSI